MYGKFYEQTFTGSMAGKGPVVFAVWAYVISHQREIDPDPEGMLAVEVNSLLVAAMIGCQRAEVEAALELLCSPDPQSRSTDYEGRRMIHEGGMEYSVVKGRKFRSMRNETERREYKRIHQRQKREEEKEKAKGILSMRTVVDHRGPQSVVSSQESVVSSQKKEESENALFVLDAVDSQPTFDDYWKLQITKKGKAHAHKAWINAITRTPASTIIAGWNAQIESERADIERGKSGIHPASWLNGERWTDEVTAPAAGKGKGEIVYEDRGTVREATHPKVAFDPDRERRNLEAFARLKAEGEAMRRAAEAAASQ